MLDKIGKLKDIINKLIYVMTPSQKKLGILCLGMSILGALLETLGVSVVIPLINALVDPGALMKNVFFGPIISLLDIDIDHVILFVGSMVVFVYLFKNAFLIVLLWVKEKYANKVFRETSLRMMDSYMKRDYPYFLSKKVGELVQGTYDNAQRVYSLLAGMFDVVSESLTLVAICVYVFFVDWKIALSVMTVGGVCLMLNARIIGTRMGNYGARSIERGAKLRTSMIEVYEGIKEIIVSKSQDHFSNIYEKNFIASQQMSIRYAIAAGSPKYVIEAVCTCGFVVAIMFKMSAQTDATSYIPTLAAFAMAAFRIMPSLGRISGSVNAILYLFPALDDAFGKIKEVDIESENWKNDHKEIIDSDEKMFFRDSIEIRKVCWSYSNNREILHDLELIIKKNQCVGIIGSSGSGKTTLMDVILGLLKPQSGSVYCDGKDVYSYPVDWAGMISYVPQSSHITSDPVRNNVAFGVDDEKIDDRRVWDALEAAQIADVVRNLSDGIYTEIGEKGVRLSGGQRQRIAIARALYRNPEIIIFDEATSALDNETEAAVMQSIDSLLGTKTMVIVAHRLTTLRNCDKIVEIIDKKAVERDKSYIFG